MMVRSWLISGALTGAAFLTRSHGGSAKSDPMILKLRNFAALAGATLLACWNLASAQIPSPPCLAVGTSAPPTCGATPTTPGNGPASDPFPRTYLNVIGGNKGLYISGNTLAGVPLATVAAQSNIVEINPYLGFEQDYNTTVASLMKNWKAAGTANGITVRTLLYNDGWANQYGVSGGTILHPWLENALNNSSMWAYTTSNASGNGDGGKYLTGYTGDGNSGQAYFNICTPYNTQTVAAFTYNNAVNALQGYTLWNMYGQYFSDVWTRGLALSKYGEAKPYAANPYLDGMFIDNMYPSVYLSGSVTATWLGRGTAPVGETAQTTACVQQGQARLVNAIQSAWPNALVAGNTGYAEFVLSNRGTTDPSYRNLYSIAFQEGAIGVSNSIESRYNSPPGAFMQGLIGAEASVAPGGTLVVCQSGLPGGQNGLDSPQSSWGKGVGSNWQALRYGFALTMQRNYHFCWNGGNQQYSNVGLLDEQLQTVSGSPNAGWLSAGSQRLDPPQSAAWSNGVWRRRFPNGWVLWNPRGNGKQTVTIPSTLCRIKTRGYGDDNVNSGACGATSVTLQDADGLFLIGTG
jgi:hypothetical protein